MCDLKVASVRVVALGSVSKSTMTEWLTGDDNEWQLYQAVRSQVELIKLKDK